MKARYNLQFLETFIDSVNNYYVPQSVADEIAVKHDDASNLVKSLIDSNKLEVREIGEKIFREKALQLNHVLGKGESDAIALGLELQADYLILDDRVARGKAQESHLKLKGTLGIIRTLHLDGQILIEDKAVLYQQLKAIKFRIKKELFDILFQDCS